GANRKAIMTQFLLESVIITVSGGIVGILIGIGCAQLVNSLANVPVQVTATPIILAFAVSAFVGVFFGLYPARKASLLKPIDALRFQ
ncbi:MAG: hypothetical protein RLZZ144_612, partial [Pseudomonadota bacterium]